MVSECGCCPTQPFSSAKIWLPHQCGILYGDGASKYPFKYILKGHDLAYIRVANANEDTIGGPSVVNYHEFSQIFKVSEFFLQWAFSEANDIVQNEDALRVRYQSAIEAYMRLWGYWIAKVSHVVVKLTVHLPGKKPIRYSEEDVESAVEQFKKTGSIKQLHTKNFSGNI